MFWIIGIAAVVMAWLRVVPDIPQLSMIVFVVGMLAAAPVARRISWPRQDVVSAVVSYFMLLAITLSEVTRLLVGRLDATAGVLAGITFPLCGIAMFAGAHSWSVHRQRRSLGLLALALVTCCLFAKFGTLGQL